MFHIVTQQCNRDLSRFSTRTRSEVTKGLRSGFTAASPVLSGVANGVLLDSGAAQSGRSHSHSRPLPTGPALTGDIDEIARLFHAPVFSTGSPSSSRVAWDAIVFPSDPAIPAQGYFDALALPNELLSVLSQSGFPVQFNVLGSGTVSSQPIERRGSTSFLSRTESACPDPGGRQSNAVALRRHAPLRYPRSCAVNRVGAP